jgi:hypothetical protein
VLYGPESLKRKEGGGSLRNTEYGNPNAKGNTGERDYSPMYWLHETYVKKIPDLLLSAELVR